MPFTDEVDWGARDFAVFGALIACAGAAFESAVHTTRSNAYRAGAGVALATTFLVVWVSGAVGIIGDEDNAANPFFGGVLAVAVVGAFVVRFRPHAMRLALVATALAQALVPLVAASGALDTTTLIGNGVFVVLWLTSAWLFRKAAREAPDVGPAR